MLSIRMIAIVFCPVLYGCAAEDMHVAETARTSLIGLSEVELADCLGLPDQKFSSGKTTLYTYNAASGRNLSLTVPFVNGIGMSFSGYCHATIRLEASRVTEVSYSGDKMQFGSQDAVCAPIVRACLERRGALPAR